MKKENQQYIIRKYIIASSAIQAIQKDKTTIEEKICLVCMKVFTKRKKYSKNQWNKRLFCSKTCSSKYRQSILWNDPEYIKMMIETHKGYVMWEEQRKKISIALSKPRPNQTGEKRGKAWKGGVTRNLKEYKKVMDRKRRSMVYNAEGSHTQQDWEKLKEKYDYICLCCKKQEPEVKLTEDHIVPISRGGSDYISNIQPLCQSCNSRKSTKTISWIDEKWRELQMQQKPSAIGFSE
jgi:5-methylcytosine-specific restriction endonuclease McrA